MAVDSQISLEHVLPKIGKIRQGILKLQSKMSGIIFLTTVQIARMPAITPKILVRPSLRDFKCITDDGKFDKNIITPSHS